MRCCFLLTRYFWHREVLVALAARHKKPTVYPIREFAAGRGLVSYGTNYPVAYGEVGDYVGRVLSGENPEDLPVRQVTKLASTSRPPRLSPSPSRPHCRPRGRRNRVIGASLRCTSLNVVQQFVTHSKPRTMVATQHVRLAGEDDRFGYGGPIK